MKATVLMGTLMLMAGCAAQPAYETPATAGGSAANGASYTQAQAEPCDRSDYPYGAAGDADYANCVIQN